jgi:hypothetical protein
MNSVAFESKRPVLTVDFVPPDPPRNSSLYGQLEISKILEWFFSRQQWIFSGRTARSREIRRFLVQEEIAGNLHLSAIARRFGVSRQSVHEQLCGLRNLTGFNR